MKTKNIISVLVIMLFTQVMFAQKVEVNTKASSIEWLGKKITGQHEGNIQIKSGYFDLADDKITAGNFLIDMTTITNSDIESKQYNKKLVGHLKSDDFFGVEKHPTAKFVVTQSTKFSDRKATITGDITIKEKTESISFEVVRSGKEYKAKIEIDRSKFDIKYGSTSFFDDLGDKAIYDIFTLDVKLVVN
ncbi:MAG: YceI family protein [Bacteroidetes bacterium]|nr:MAG: YceI family protein [Bacteroidota bacterium]